MRFPLVLASLVLPFSTLVSAADLNGYTAKYECRAGGEYCNVDVQALANQACEQTITTSTSPTNDWSAINWSNNVICIQAGDHTGRGTLTLGSSGSSGSRKVLRYTRPGDTNDDPWKQSSADQAKISKLVTNGRHYWIVHRLTLPSADVDDRFWVNGSTHTIANRILVEGRGNNYWPDTYSGYGCWGSACDGNSDNWLQNSVVRGAGGIVNNEPSGLAIEAGTHWRVVNNEIYDYTTHLAQFGHNGSAASNPGTVVENNDFYWTPAMQTGGGSLMKGEGSLVFKTTGTAQNPIRVLNNRFWGGRWSDTSQCCIGGADGKAISITPASNVPREYILVQNNIIFDHQRGIQGSITPNARISIVGNLIYNVRQYYTGASSHALGMWSFNNTETYLNSIINSGQYYMENPEGQNSNDVKCNVMIGGSRTGSSASGSQMNSNAYYGTSNTMGDAAIINKSMTTRSNNQALVAGQVVRTTATPPENGSAGDFLYVVTVSGTTGGSAPAYCTTLGCTQADGGAQLQAIRGPYAFYRKLRTGPELRYIPYARVHSSAPEAAACPSTGSDALGIRTGIGINDSSM